MRMCPPINWLLIFSLISVPYTLFWCRDPPILPLKLPILGQFLTFMFRNSSRSLREWAIMPVLTPNNQQLLYPASTLARNYPNFQEQKDDFWITIKIGAITTSWTVPKPIQLSVELVYLYSIHVRRGGNLTKQATSRQMCDWQFWSTLGSPNFLDFSGLTDWQLFKGRGVWLQTSPTNESLQKLLDKLFFWALSNFFLRLFKTLQQLLSFRFLLPVLVLIFQSICF